jgi:hypothetical protein
MKITKIEKLNPCREAVVWLAAQKNPAEAWKNCERGDWMLWLAKRFDIDDKKLTLTKAMCAKQVEHLMKDQRSKDALQACFDYVNGKITREQLNAAAYAAAAAAVADAYAAVADAYAAVAAAYAAAAAAVAVDAYAAAAYAAAAAAAAVDVYAAVAAAAAVDAYAAVAAAYAAAQQSSLRKSADICREYLTEEVLSKYKKLK